MGHLYIAHALDLRHRKVIVRKAAKKTIFEIEDILEKVSKFTGVSVKEMKSHSRKREIADARKIYFAFCYDYMRNSLSDIGALLIRNHATVYYGRHQTYNILSKEYEAFKTLMRESSFELKLVDRAISRERI